MTKRLASAVPPRSPRDGAARPGSGISEPVPAGLSASPARLAGSSPHDDSEASRRLSTRRLSGDRCGEPLHTRPCLDGRPRATQAASGGCCKMQQLAGPSRPSSLPPLRFELRKLGHTFFLSPPPTVSRGKPQKRPAGSPLSLRGASWPLEAIQATQLEPRQPSQSA
jgi:hypothetical protein